MYLLTVWGHSEPLISGPFNSEEERVKAAQDFLKEHGSLENHIFRIDMVDGHPSVGVFVDYELGGPNRYEVEFDLAYSGGEYSNVGYFVDIEPNPGESVQDAFERVTGHSRMHIVHYQEVEEDI